jgi:hypothetical protein
MSSKSLASRPESWDAGPGEVILTRAITKLMTYEEAKAWFDQNQGQMIESRGVATVTVAGRSVRFSSKPPEQDEFVKAVSRLKRILS